MNNTEIYKLIETQGENFDLKLESLEKTVRYGFKGIRQYVDAGFETIDRKDNIRNGRIGKLEKANKDTAFFRWMHRNPIPSVAALIIAIMVGAYGYHKINIKKTVENMTKIELKDE